MEPKRIPDKLAQLLPRGGIAALTEGIELVSLWRWARLSVLIGGVVGLAAAGVYYVLTEASDALLHRLAGLDDPAMGAGHELFLYGSREPQWWILLLFLPALGGLAAGLIVWKLAPETRGAGVDPIIDAYHNRDGQIRTRVPLVKLIASLFTLGTGGSGGREGPMAQIGAGFGAYVSRTLNLSAKERRLLVLAGAAGGVSALLRAPLGAALWSLEMLYRDDFESEGLFPCLVSSVTAYSVFTLIYGQGSLLHLPPGVSYAFEPAQLIFYAVLAVACAPLAVLWIKMLHGSRRRIWEPMKLPVWLKPALGGLALGALCLALPWVFSSGYGWMQDALMPIDSDARFLPVGYKGFALLLGVAVAKMVATSLTVSSGGSAGVFGPSLFIGGFIGGAFGLLFHELAPTVVSQPGAFVLVGMGAFYAATGKVPIATIILISELFGSYDLLVPLMFSEMITVVLLRRYSLFEAQVDHASDSPAHLADFTVDVLGDLRVAEHYTPGRASETIPLDMPISTFLEHVSSTADSFFIVSNKQGTLVGSVSLSNVRSIVSEQEFVEHVLVSDAMQPLFSLSPDLDLRDALGMFLETGYTHLAVIDGAEPNVVLGILSQQQVFSAYNAEIRRRRQGHAEDDDRATV